MNFLSDWANYLSNFFGDPAIALSMVVLFMIFLLFLLKLFIGKKQLDGYVKQEDYEALQNTIDDSVNELRTLLLELLKQKSQDKTVSSNKRGRPKGDNIN